jgi:peptide/nickel transport system ATP-binding protein
VEGQILFHRQVNKDGVGGASVETVDLAALKSGSRELRSIRGGEIAMIFQEPMTSLNPVLTVGMQLIEAIRAHETVSRSAARARARRYTPLNGSRSRSS